MSPERKRLIDEVHRLTREMADVKNQMDRVEKTIPGLAWQLVLRWQDLHHECDLVRNEAYDLAHYETWSRLRMRSLGDGAYELLPQPTPSKDGEQ